METFERHLGEQLRIRVTFLDGDENRQSVAGVADMKCFIYRQNPELTPIVTDDSAHCTIEEAGPGTEGDVMYDAPPGTVPDRGRYWMVFRCTVGGVPVAFPQRGFIPLIIT